MASDFEIPEPVIKRVRELTNRPLEEIKRINEWARKHMDVLESQDFEEMVIQAGESLGMRSQVIVPSLSALLGLLFRIDDETSTEQVISAIAQTGIDPDTLDKVRHLVSGLQFTNVEFSRGKSHAIHSGAPTLDSVEGVTDLRAVFKAEPEEPSGKDQDQRVRQFLGFFPIGVMSIVVNDSGGSSKTITFQVGVPQSKRLLRAVRNLVTQLEQLDAFARKTSGTGL